MSKIKYYLRLSVIITYIVCYYHVYYLFFNQVFLQLIFGTYRKHWFISSLRIVLFNIYYHREHLKLLICY